MDGDLYKLYKSSGKFNRLQIINFLKQMLGALEFLHTNGILHSDIKPANILYTFDQDGDQDGEIKFYLADFGLSQFYSIPAPIRAYSTTPIYGPHTKYENRDKRFDNFNTINLDLYALALVCLYLITGFQGKEVANVYEYFNQENQNKYNKYHLINIIGLDGWDLLSKMWGLNKDNIIISAQDALKHSFLTGIIGGDELHIYTSKNYLNRERELNYIDNVTIGLKNDSCFFTIGSPSPQPQSNRSSPQYERLSGYDNLLLFIINNFANIKSNLVTQTNTNLLAIQILRRVINARQYISNIDIHISFYIAACLCESAAFPIVFNFKKTTIIDLEVRKYIFDILNIIYWRPILYPYGAYIEKLILENYILNPTLLTPDLIKIYRLVCETCMTFFYIDNDIHEYLFKNQVTLNEFSNIIYYIASTIIFKNNEKYIKSIEINRNDIFNYLNNTLFVTTFKNQNQIDYKKYNIPCRIIKYISDHYIY